MSRRARRRIKRLPRAVARDLEATRPRTWGDCLGENGSVPWSRMPFCPWVSCRHHLLMQVSEAGNLRFNHRRTVVAGGLEITAPVTDPSLVPAACSLAEAEATRTTRGPRTLHSVGKVIGLTRERVRQIEEAALVKMRRRSGR